MPRAETFRQPEFKRYKIDHRIGLTIGALGLIAFFVGVVDGTSTDVKMNIQAINKYPLVSSLKIESVNKEILLFNQKLDQAIVRGDDLSSALAVEEKIKLSENMQILEQDNLRLEYRQRLENQEPKKTLDPNQLMFGGFGFAILGGLSLLEIEIQKATKKTKI